MKKIIGFISLLLLSACSNEYRFHGPAEEVTKTQDPVPEPPNNTQETPTPVPPVVPPVEKLQFSSGSCTQSGIQLLSCSSCKINTKPIEPDYSLKAMQLMKIMKTACKVKNSSDPKTSLASERALFKFLNQANKVNYPDTLASATEAKLLNELTNENSSYYKKLFGGLWYQPPYSDAFETYFGIATQEAKSLFCYQVESPTFSLKSYTQLVSKEFSDCQNSDFLSFNCKEKDSYIQGNKTRSFLHKAIKKSLSEPFQEGRVVATNKCHWEKIQGVFNAEMEEVIVTWVNQGFQVSVQHEAPQPLCESLRALTQDLDGKMSAAAYICEDL